MRLPDHKAGQREAERDVQPCGGNLFENQHSGGASGQAGSQQKQQFPEDNAPVMQRDKQSRDDAAADATDQNGPVRAHDQSQHGHGNQRTAHGCDAGDETAHRPGQRDDRVIQHFHIVPPGC